MAIKNRQQTSHCGCITADSDPTVIQITLREEWATTQTEAAEGRELRRMKIRSVALWIAVLCAISGSAMVGCQYFPEATFELGSESRLPKWVTLSPGLTRADVSVTMSYYVKPWGGSALFILQDPRKQTPTKVYGKLRGLEPLQLKNPPQGFPRGYPSYEIVTVNGITDIIEHRKMEPIFYVTDDPAVWNELLGVRASNP